jgi:hypothetical protein
LGDIFFGMLLQMGANGAFCQELQYLKKKKPKKW